MTEAWEYTQERREEVMFCSRHKRYGTSVLSLLVMIFTHCPIGINEATAYELLVTNHPSGGAKLQLHDSDSGDLIRVVAEGIRVSANMTYGPGGDIYVADSYRPIYRLDGHTFNVIEEFATTSRNYNYGIAFGPDGNLYVSGIDHDRIERFDGTTGEYIDNAVSGINYPQGMTFGPDGNIYVGSYRDNLVYQYDGQTGSLIQPFTGGGGLVDPRGLKFGPDGNLYVTSWGTGEVIRYDGVTGQFVDTFATVPHSTGSYGPTDIQFAPDGDLYVVSLDVRQYDGHTGDFVRVAVTDLAAPYAILFVPEPASVAMLTSLVLVYVSGRRGGRNCANRRRNRITDT